MKMLKILKILLNEFKIYFFKLVNHADSAVSDFAVSLTPLSQAPLCR